ncbi:MAG: T9SS type A sorting domain-containing protein [Sphingobacteriaceae bacterium]|nr:T9SS type A sorting domain-containing protein [Sphingobacteriaceae bacterium]
MRLNLSILFIVLGLAFCNAQTLTYTPGKTYSLNLALGDAATVPIQFEHNEPKKINLTYTNVSYSFPAGWEIGVCDTYNCMAGVNPGNWELDSLPPGSVNAFYIQLSVDPKNIIGAGFLKVYLWQNDQPNNGDTLIWRVNAQAVGVEEISSNSTIKLFPNPVTDVLIIDNSFQENTPVSLTDALGRKVMTTILSNNSNSINLSSIEKGVYTLIIESKGKQFYKRIVKE